MRFGIYCEMQTPPEKSYETMTWEILRQIERRGEQVQPEYHRATPECPHPERWSMFDSMSAEVEVLEFLRTVVTTIKPELVVETGSFSGISTLWIAEGLKANGRGKVVSCESDAKVFAAAQLPRHDEIRAEDNQLNRARRPDHQDQESHSASFALLFFGSESMARIVAFQLGRVGRADAFGVRAEPVG